jgi:hypothetical protein
MKQKKRRGAKAQWHKGIKVEVEVEQSNHLPLIAFVIIFVITT